MFIFSNHQNIYKKRSFIKLNHSIFIICFYLSVFKFFILNIDVDLNNILVFDSRKYRSGNLAINSNGDMIVEYSIDSYRLFYGLDKNGLYYFTDTENNEIHTKEINITNSGGTYVGRYESKNLFISLKDYINNNKQYLFSTSSYHSVTELYDLEDLDNNKIITTQNFLEYEIFSYQYSLLELTTESQKEYLLMFTVTTDESNKGNLLLLKKIAFIENNLDNCEISEEILDNNYNRLVSGFVMQSLIVIFYLNRTPQYSILIYDFSLTQLGTAINIETIGSYNKGDGLFFKCIHLKDNIGIFVYYKDTSIYIPILKIGSIDVSTYSFTPLITTNIDDYSFINTAPLLNDLIKINDNRFSFIATTTDAFSLYIYLYDLYNNNENLKIRLYKPNLTNYKFVKEMSTIIFNNYLVFTSSVVDPINYSSEDNDCFSIFMIFGFANGTDSIIDISSYFMDDNVNNENNIIKKLKDYLIIDNNIFGYEFAKQIKLITIPDHILFFNKDNKDVQLSNNNILNFDYIFKQNTNMIKTDDFYSLSYQFIIQEPEYNEFNNYPISIKEYPYSGSADQISFFSQNKFYGRTNKLEFKLCHDYCGSCYKIGTNINDQKCVSCLPDYQYDYPSISPPNCVPEGYYKNKNSLIVPYTQGNPKFFTNINSHKTIYFDNSLYCPEEYAFLIINTNECKSSCSYLELLTKNCLLQQDNYLIYELLKNLINEYPIDGESLVIEGEDQYAFQLTTSFNELDTLEGFYDNVYNLSMIDLCECETLLKGQNTIDDDTPLIFLKFEKLTNSVSEKNVQYEIYHPISKQILNLSICQNTTIDLYIPVTLSEKTKDLYNDLQESGYDLFNINDSFYTDICTPYKSENGTDVLLSDRKNDYYNANETTCQDKCQYSSYSLDTEYLKCECNIEEEEIDVEEPEKFSGKMILHSFYDVLKYSNIHVIKCFSLVFDLNSITNNYGSIMVIAYFALYVIFFIVFIVKGINPIKIDVVKAYLEKPKENINNDNKKNNKKVKIRDKSKNINKGNNISIKKKDRSITTEIVISKGNNKNKLDKDNNNSIKLSKFNRINIHIPPKRKANPSKINETNNSVNIYKKDKNEHKKERYIKLDAISLNNNTRNINSKRRIIESPKIKINSKFKNDQNELLFQVKTDKQNKEEKMDDFELNDLEYVEAIDLDKRPFHQIYWVTLKREHSILFTFFSWNDYNLWYIKFVRFIFLVCTDMAMNVFFFSDDSMHKLYLNYGEYDFIQQIPQIIYSTIISQLLEVFLCYLSLTDKHIYEIKRLKNNNQNKIEVLKIIKCINIKLICFFVFTFVMFAFYWYIITAFCAVYQNTQKTFIKDSLSSFVTSLLTPFPLYLLPVTLRIIALKDIQKKRLKFIYKLSDIIPFF